MTIETGGITQDRAALCEDIWLSIPAYMHKAIEAAFAAHRQAGISEGRREAAEIARATPAYDDLLQKSSGCHTTGERIAARILAKQEGVSASAPEGDRE